MPAEPDIAVLHDLAQRNTSQLAGMYARYAAGDREAVIAALAEDAEWSSEAAGLPWSGRFTGPAGARDYFARLDAAIEVRGYDLEQVIAQGEWVIVLATVRLRFLASGREEVFRKVDTTRLRDGTVVEFREYYDSGRVAAALGAPESLSKPSS